MKSIIIVGCYFGQKRKDYKTWLKSCEYNKTVDWIIFSDSDWGQLPKNVKVIYKTFEEIKKEIQSKFNFKITLNTPYKLCDYKPAYGYIFEEYTSKYDFWGYCDFDMIFGDLRHFLTEDVLEKYDKILKLGHLSLYKNCGKDNQLFMKEVSKGADYKEVFTTNEIKVFDEKDGINDIYIKHNKKIYYEDIFIDLSKFSKEIIITKNQSTKENFPYQTVLFDHGKLFYYYIKNGEPKEREIIYVHFSGKLFDAKSAEKFALTKNGIVEIKEKLDWQICKNKFLWMTLKFNSIRKIIFKVKRKIRKMINRRIENELKKQKISN